MNKDWAEKNKKMQSLTGKEASFREGLDVLFELRDDLFGQISSIVNTYPAEAVCRGGRIPQQDAGLFHVAYLPDRGYRRAYADRTG